MGKNEPGIYIYIYNTDIERKIKIHEAKKEDNKNHHVYTHHQNYDQAKLLFGLTKIDRGRKRHRKGTAGIASQVQARITKIINIMVPFYLTHVYYYGGP